MNTDLNDVLAFTAVADSGSFTRAAERLGWPKSSVSHRVARLEASLGARLLERSTRRLRLTDVGARFHEHARRVLQELDLATATVERFRARPQGRLRVSASVVLGQALLPAMVAEYVAQHPDVDLFVDLTNRRVDLLEEGVDLAIRAGELPDSSLVSRRLGSATARLFAAPSYLRRHGSPATAAHLAKHVLVDNAPAPPATGWTLTHDDGSTHEVSERCRLAANDASLVLDLATAALGIVTLPVFVAAPAVAAGRLVPVLPRWATRRVEVHAVFPSHKSLSPAVRAFIDLAVARLGSALEGH